MTAEPGTKPARGYKSPSLTKGAGAALNLSNGVKAQLVYLPLSEELAAGLIEARPDLARYPAAVARYCEWEGRAMLMRRHLAIVGDLDAEVGNSNAKVREGVTQWLWRCEQHAAKAAAVLGLDPMSEAKLSRERATSELLGVSLDEVAERGRKTIAAQIAEGTLDQPDDLAGKHLERVKSEAKTAYRAAVIAAGGDPAKSRFLNPPSDPVTGTDD